jgi:phosphoribosylglycinamide formyltransferase-1
MNKIAILASGNGSNAQQIAHYFADNQHVQVTVLLSDNPQAAVHQRMKILGIPTFSFSKQEVKNGTPLLQKLSEFQIDWVILAGFLSKIPENVVDFYSNRIVNIHPALLPKFGGKGMYGMHVHQAVVNNQEKITGITIHFVNEYYDQGDIIFQATCNVEPTDSPDVVAQKVHLLEYQYFPQVVDKLINGELPHTTVEPGD